MGASVRLPSRRVEALNPAKQRGFAHAAVGLESAATISSHHSVSTFGILWMTNVMDVICEQRNVQLQNTVSKQVYWEQHRRAADFEVLDNFSMAGMLWCFLSGWLRRLGLTLPSTDSSALTGQ